MPGAVAVAAAEATTTTNTQPRLNVFVLQPSSGVCVLDKDASFLLLAWHFKKCSQRVAGTQHSPPRPPTAPSHQAPKNLFPHSLALWQFSKASGFLKYVCLPMLHDCTCSCRRPSSRTVSPIRSHPLHSEIIWNAKSCGRQAQCGRTGAGELPHARTCCSCCWDLSTLQLTHTHPFALRVKASHTRTYSLTDTHTHRFTVAGQSCVAFSNLLPKDYSFRKGISIADLQEKVFF